MQRPILDCFAGIGGFSLAAHRAGCDIRAQIEIDKYKRFILKRRFPDAKKFTDICTTSADDIRRLGRIWAVCGGFPCTDLSQAARGREPSLAGARSGLWWHMWRVIQAARPDWLLIENVPNLRLHGSDSVLLSLETLGYTGIPFVVGAWNVLASHKRDRVFILGYPASLGLETPEAAQQAISWLGSYIRASLNVANANGNAVRQPGKQFAWSSQKKIDYPLGQGIRQHDWEQPRLCFESRLAGTGDGLSRGLDGSRVQALGDAIVPEIAETFFRVMIQLERFLNATEERAEVRHKPL